ncbi:MAG: 1-phosphofructokinase family hexose kinase [Lewinellaceae bacterium]|nr:1-phosphofructokinase family hexose kinase [Lewinellaceae bacterium]
MLIVTLTLNPALDKSSSVEQLTPESKLRCSPVKTDAGGGGINVSKGIHKLGGKSTAVFPAGGATGLLLSSLLEQEGIATRALKVQGDTRENFSILETSSNLQYRFTMPGLPITVEEADACLELVAELKPDILVVSGSLPPGLPSNYYQKVAGFSKYINAKMVLDTSGVPLRAAAHEGIFMLKPNLGELSAMAGVEKLEMNQVDDAALQVVHQGMCEVVVVSLGAQGALLATKDGFEHIPAPMVRKTTTVGAGDSMVAGMIWAMSEGKSYKEMVQTGVACGSAATLNTGTELFFPADVHKLLSWIKTYGERYKYTDF